MSAESAETPTKEYRRKCEADGKDVTLFNTWCDTIIAAEKEIHPDKPLDQIFVFSVAERLMKHRKDRLEEEDAVSGVWTPVEVAAYNIFIALGAKEDQLPADPPPVDGDELSRTDAAVLLAGASDAEVLEIRQDANKRGKSKQRYEAYKKATTVRQFLELGGTVSDLKHDLESQKNIIQIAAGSTFNAATLVNAAKYVMGIVSRARAPAPPSDVPADEAFADDRTKVDHQYDARLDSDLKDTMIMGHPDITTLAGGRHILSQATMHFTNGDGVAEVMPLYFGRGLWAKLKGDDHTKLYGIIFAERAADYDDKGDIVSRTRFRCFEIAISTNRGHVTFSVRSNVSQPPVVELAEITGLSNLADSTQDKVAAAINESKFKQTMFALVSDVSKEILKFVEEAASGTNRLKQWREKLNKIAHEQSIDRLLSSFKDKSKKEKLKAQYKQYREYFEKSLNENWSPAPDEISNDFFDWALTHSQKDIINRLNPSYAPGKTQAFVKPQVERVVRRQKKQIQMEREASVAAVVDDNEEDDDEDENSNEDEESAVPNVTYNFPIDTDGKILLSFVLPEHEGKTPEECTWPGQGLTPINHKGWRHRKGLRYNVNPATYAFDSFSKGGRKKGDTVKSGAVTEYGSKKAERDVATEPRRTRRDQKKSTPATGLIATSLDTDVRELKAEKVILKRENAAYERKITALQKQVDSATLAQEALPDLESLRRLVQRRDDIFRSTIDKLKAQRDHFRDSLAIALKLDEEKRKLLFPPDVEMTDTQPLDDFFEEASQCMNKSQNKRRKKS